MLDVRSCLLQFRRCGDACFLLKEPWETEEIDFFINIKGVCCAGNYYSLFLPFAIPLQYTHILTVAIDSAALVRLLCLALSHGFHIHFLLVPMA